MAVGRPPNSSDDSSARAAGGEGELPNPPLLLEVIDLDGIFLPPSGSQHVFQVLLISLVCMSVLSCFFEFYSLLGFFLGFLRVSFLVLYLSSLAFILV